MYFVCSLQSELDSERYYVGITTDITRRIEDHNAGKSVHTNMFKPWKRRITDVAFSDRSKAERSSLFKRLW